MRANTAAETSDYKFRCDGVSSEALEQQCEFNYDFNREAKLLRDKIRKSTSARP
jgi:hypothetical protein